MGARVPASSLMTTTLKQFITFLRLFYHYTRWRLPVLYLLIAVGGVIEVIGIVSLLPLLNVAIGDTADSRMLRIIVDALAAVGIAPTLSNMLLVIVATFTTRGLFVYLYTYFTARIALGVRREVQIEFTRRFCDMSFPYYTRQTAGWFNNIIVGEIGRFVASLRAFSRLSVNAINALIFLPLALSLRFELTLAVFALGVVVLWSLMGFIRRTARLSREQTVNAGRLNAEFIQLIQAFIYLKATNTMDAANRHVIHTIGDLTDIELRIKRVASLFAAIQEPIAVAALAAFIFYEVIVLGGPMSEVIVVALLLYRILMQLVSLAPQMQTFSQTVGGVFVVQDVSRDFDRHVEATGKHDITTLDTPIVFHDVSFRYGNTDILRNIDIDLRPNETVGIVGESGSGKTTFFHLLTGLLEPCGGHITIGDMPYAEIDRRALRARIGYVTQEPVIFNDTVANNISLWQYDGRDKACLERIRSAARTAKCDGFVGAMPEGYDTPLGDRGIKLSGGERQRIAIAREIFKQPGLLIFDEAASALDAGSERYVQESIDRMRGQRTVVVITHRLASVRRCHRVYVFREGRVVEQGTFDDLYAAEDSYFRSLCMQQGVSP